MNNESEIRRNAKLDAKRRLGERIGQCMIAVLLYMLPLMALGILMAPMQGDSDMHIIKLMLLGLAGEIILCGPLTYGLMSFLVVRSRGGDTHLPMLFAPYGSLRDIWRSVRMMLCIAFRTMLIMLIPAIILVGGVYITAPYFGASAAYPYIASMLFVLICLPVYVKAIGYLAGYLVLFDNPDMGVWQATRIAAKRFAPHFKLVLLLMFSFIPWALLSVLSAGATMLIAMPYFVMSVFRLSDRFSMDDDPTLSGSDAQQ